jgi:RNA polymerase sigma-70 factor (ECF subfamily)
MLATRCASRRTPAAGQRLSSSVPRAFADRRDQLLLTRARCGDQAAFDELYVRNFAAVRGTVRRICATEPSGVDEVVQDVFIAAWRSLAGHGIAAHDPARGGVGGWLCMIARARAIDAMRAVRLRQTRGQSPAGDELDHVAAQEVPVADVIRAETAAELRSAVAGLPRTQREIVELAYFRELTHSEIAQALAVPIGTVKGRLRLSYSRLRPSLSELARGQPTSPG